MSSFYPSPKNAVKNFLMRSWLLFFIYVITATANASIHSVRVADGLTEPVFVTAPSGDARLFVLERAGIVKIVESGSILAQPFLDISGLVSTFDSFGFFGLAFDPDYASSGLFYVYYINNSMQSIIARYQVSANPNIANPVGETVISIAQTASDHNGGTIAFSPSDGYLYIALGDGGGGPYDPDERGQDPQSLLGKMLRIDVSGGIGTTYTVPPDNPFIGNAGVLDEIWSFGLRNPIRWSFDRDTADLWIGDVGQEAKEEILFEPQGSGGRNYGWDVMEGTLCNVVDPAPSPPCNDPSLTLPFVEYDHNSDPNCSGSITGGYVYRGPINVEETGLYFYGDFCTGEIWTISPQTKEATNRTTEITPSLGGHTIDPFTIIGFGEGGSGELYVVDYGGEVFRIDPDVNVPFHMPIALSWLLLVLSGLWVWRVRRRSLQA